MNIVCRAGVGVFPIGYSRSWGHLVIITAFHRSHLRGLRLSRGHRVGFTMIPLKFHPCMLWGVEGHSPTYITALLGGSRATAGTTKLLLFPITRAPAIPSILLFVTGDMLPNITRTTTHDRNTIILATSQLSGKRGSRKV